MLSFIIRHDINVELDRNVKLCEMFQLLGLGKMAREVTD